MNKISGLSRDELVSLIYNTWKDTDVEEVAAECATCGKTPNAKYFYICDKCRLASIDHECHTCGIEARQCYYSSQNLQTFPCEHWSAPK